MEAIQQETQAFITATDERAYSVGAALIKKGDVRFLEHYYKKIGASKQLLWKIKNGQKSFMLHHIAAICKEYNVNANFIFGLEGNMWRK